MVGRISNRHGDYMATDDGMQSRHLDEHLKCRRRHDLGVGSVDAFVVNDRLAVINVEEVPSHIAP